MADSPKQARATSREELAECREQLELTKAVLASIGRDAEHMLEQMDAEDQFIKRAALLAVIFGVGFLSGLYAATIGL